MAKHVEIWLDSTSDSEDPKWIVDVIKDGDIWRNITIEDDEDDAIEEAMEYGRDQGLGVYQRQDDNSLKELASSELMEMASLLQSHGSRFAGNHVDEIAEGWINHDFDADSADEWCIIGVWDAATAAAFRDAGLNATQVAMGAQWMIDDGICDEDDDPIYAACNGDIDAKEIIDAAHEVS